MILELDKVTVKSEKVLYKLKKYLDTLCQYANFDKEQMMHIFVDSEGDFCAVESVKYRLNFTSPDHKMMDLISSPYIVPYVPFSQLKKHISSL